jgi:mannose-1-phosphate guanylyltransferase
MQAMVLAAGFGTRLRPYTLVRPKPLFPILNEPLLILLLDKLKQAGCRRVVVNCHHLADQIEAAVAGRDEVILQYEPEILGTGGSLRRATDHFDDGPVLVMNGDIYHDINIHRLLEHHRQSPCSVTLAMHKYPRFHAVNVSKDKVRGFGQNSCGPGEEMLAFTGIHVLDRQVIGQIPASGFFHIIDLYGKLAKQSLVGSLRVDGCFWQDIGTTADYLDLHRHLLVDCRVEDPSAQPASAWKVSPEAVVAPDVVLEGWGVIGSGASIGRGSRLSCCVVWENARVNAGEQLADTIIGPWDDLLDR